MVLDPRTNAVRPDLADIRLAEHVFAPHYAAPVLRIVDVSVALRLDRSPDALLLAMLDPGAAFELLDLVGADAWGIAADAGLVGYVDAAALKAST